MSGVAPILVYATRYALGRQTGAAEDVLTATRLHLLDLRYDHGCREAMRRDIAEALGHHPDLYARDVWTTMLGLLDAAGEKP